MIASLAWKEYREQRPIWLTVALLAAVLVFGVLEFVSPIGTARYGTAKYLTLTTICFALSIGYGLVVGALLIAGERESGTLDFLDMNAGRRLTVWATKTIVGAAGVLVLSRVLDGILIWYATSGTVSVQALLFGPSGWLRDLPLCSLYAFVAGLLASATSRSVFRAAGLGLFYCIAFLLVGLLFSLVLAMTFTGPDAFTGVLRLAMTVLGPVILYGSYRLSCGADLSRQSAVDEASTESLPWHARLAGLLRPVIWLTWEQGRGLMLGVLIAAVSITISLAATVLVVANLSGSLTSGTLVGLMSWPFCALVIGVVSGMATFAGEQGTQAKRFLGDQRLPIGRIWLLKTLMWLLFAAMVSLLIAAIVSLVVSSRSSFHSWIVPNEYRDMTLWPSRLNAASWLLFSLSVSYGFALGQFLVLFFQRPAIAGFLAIVTSLGSLIWVPSLVAGGTHWYAVLLPPVILLGGARVLMSSWSAGFPTAKGRMIWAATLLLSVASLALGIGQRVWEIPDVPLPFDVEAYAKSLSTPLGTEAGILTHSALHEMQQRIELASGRFPAYQTHLDVPWLQAARAAACISLISGVATQSLTTDPAPALVVAQLPVDQAWNAVAEARWTVQPVNRLFAANGDIDMELAQVIEFVCDGSWISKLERLRELPMGAIMDPREWKEPWFPPDVQDAHLATAILCDRALLWQGQGQLEKALADYETALKLVLTMGNQANDHVFIQAGSSAYAILRELRHWGAKAAHRADLLNRAQDALEQFERSLPTLVDVNKSSYLATRSFLSQPQLPKRWSTEPHIAHDNSMSLVPWEAERRLRLLNAVFAGRIKAASLPFAEWLKSYREGLSGLRREEELLMEGWMAPTSNGLPLISSEELARWLDQTWWQTYLSAWGTPFRLARLHASIRAAELRFALIKYSVDNGRAALTLADLVPKYIRDVPTDPYDGKPFRYRVSAGKDAISRGAYEGVTSMSIPEAVPGIAHIVWPGQGILWCVGPDLVDDHGAVENEDDGYLKTTKKRGDIVFIVPSVNELLR
jgi:ABC-type transport system involved in multi-copper enzyme maturation permease subunit